LSKIVSSSKEAVLDIPGGSSILIGGFGICGIAQNLCKAIRQRNDVGEFHLLPNAGGMDSWCVGLMFENRQIRSIIASRVGPACKAYEEQALKGEIDVELSPQGTFTERIRAGGAGIGGFFTPTGAGTIVAEGKETRIIEGQEYIFEEPIRADYALIKAWKGDEHGNLVYRMSAQNFNPVMATAAEVTIAEVEEIVPVGDIVPENVHTPGIFVQRVVLGEDVEKPIEIMTNRPRNGFGGS